MTTPPPDLILKLLALGQEGIKKIFSLLEAFKAQSYKQLSYKEIVDEVVNNKPKHPAIVKAAVLKKQCENGDISVTICYLNKNNEPVWGDDPNNPYGCSIVTKELDSELQKMFGSKDTIIFE